VLALAGGATRVPGLPAGLPLGLGAGTGSFEATQISLPPGTTSPSSSPASARVAEALGHLNNHPIGTLAGYLLLCKGRIGRAPAFVDFLWIAANRVVRQSSIT
jgi:hypothetical protein